MCTSTRTTPTECTARRGGLRIPSSAVRLRDPAVGTASGVESSFPSTCSVMARAGARSWRTVPWWYRDEEPDRAPGEGSGGWSGSASTPGRTVEPAHSGRLDSAGRRGHVPGHATAGRWPALVSAGKRPESRKSLIFSAHRRSRHGGGRLISVRSEVQLLSGPLRSGSGIGPERNLSADKLLRRSNLSCCGAMLFPGWPAARRRRIAERSTRRNPPEPADGQQVLSKSAGPLRSRGAGSNAQRRSAGTRTLPA